VIRVTLARVNTFTVGTWLNAVRSASGIGVRRVGKLNADIAQDINRVSRDEIERLWYNCANISRYQKIYVQPWRAPG